MPLKTTAGNHGEAAKGRGATINPEGRFEKVQRESFDDEWYQEAPEGDAAKPKTVIAIERVKTIIAHNDSPDLGFTSSLNPYRGCAHGCPFCFARPSHAYYGLSPGIDFETRLTAKVNAAEKLREEFSKPGYSVDPIAIGVNTDAYQPIERQLRITRSVLELLNEVDHPATLITKNALIERDIDILAEMANKRLVHTTMTVITLDPKLSRYLQPRASAPARQLLAIERLAKAGIPVNVNIAPVIPFLTDHELEKVMEAAVNAGASTAYYTLLRLPWEVKDIFKAWLEQYFPLKAAHVMARVHEMREGRDNDPNFGTRMTGKGLFSDLLRQRYEKACARFGLDRKGDIALDTTRFVPPSPPGQGRLF